METVIKWGINLWLMRKFSGSGGRSPSPSRENPGKGIMIVQ